MAVRWGRLSGMLDSAWACGPAASRLAVVPDKLYGVSDDFAVDSGHSTEQALEFVEDGFWREPFHLADRA